MFKLESDRNTLAPLPPPNPRATLPGTTLVTRHPGGVLIQHTKRVIVEPSQRLDVAPGEHMRSLGQIVPEHLVSDDEAKSLQQPVDTATNLPDGFQVISVLLDDAPVPDEFVPRLG